MFFSGYDFILLLVLGIMFFGYGTVYHIVNDYKNRPNLKQFTRINPDGTTSTYYRVVPKEPSEQKKNNTNKSSIFTDIYEIITGLLVLFLVLLVAAIALFFIYMIISFFVITWSL